MDAETRVRRWRLARRVVPVLMIALTSFPLTGCDTTNRISRPDPVLSFSPQSVVTRGLRFQTGSGSGNVVLEIEVVSVALGDVASLSYDFVYPTDLFRHTGVEEASYLSEDGDVDTRLQVTEPMPGVLQVDHAREPGSGPFEPELADGVTLRATFEGIGTGQGTFALRNIRAFRSDGSEIEDVDEIEARVIIDLANAA
jgi:hypothetical protein